MLMDLLNQPNQRAKKTKTLLLSLQNYNLNDLFGFDYSRIDVLKKTR
jgi:hypothetical protein